MAVTIKVPAEAVVPLVIGMFTLGVLIFAGATLVSWKTKHPRAALIVGLVIAIALSAFVLYKAAVLIPEKYIDLGPPDHPPISLADGPILGFTTVIATLFWRFANQRWVALGLGTGLGVALIAKPFVLPLAIYFSSGSERACVPSDPDTLSIVGPGVACLIAGLIVGLRRPTS